MGRSITTVKILAVTITLSVIFLAGCSAPKEAEKPAPTADETLKKYEAEFKPSEYDPEPKGRMGHSGSENGEFPDSSAVEPETPASVELISGFRVQLLATTSIDEANARKTEAEGVFPGEWIYVEYDPPTYKVRAGNFQSRIEADRFAKLASSKGFQEAWAVPERVYKQPPPVSKPAVTPEEQR